MVAGWKMPGFLLITIRDRTAGRELTSKLKGIDKDLKIELLDHIVLNSNARDYLSFRQAALYLRAPV